MSFTAHIPELNEHNCIPGLVTMALKGPQCPTYAGRVILLSFVRLVEAARMHYRAGRFASRNYAADVAGFGSLLEATAGFEACIDSMHRAVRCMKTIRSKDELNEVSTALFRERPPFMIKSVENKIRNVRDAIQHSYDRVFKGEIEDGATFMLGFVNMGIVETLYQNPPRSNIVWDGVEIGSDRLSFAEIATWLGQMSACALAIVSYSPGSGERC